VPEPGEQVLIVGAGIIGLLTLQSVKAVAPNAHVTVMARFPQQIEAAAAFGADEIVTSGDLFSETARITGAEHFTAPLNRGMLLGGFSVIYDCVGSAATIGDGIRCVRAGGALVIIGITPKMMKLDLSPLYVQEVDLIGSNTYGIERWDGRDVHTFQLVIEMFQEGRLTDQGLITHRFPFAQIKDAIRTAEDKRTGCIKVSITYP
jgi:threonine dehydrogenase-like Zn-dependent dehydrogenase